MQVKNLMSENLITIDKDQSLTDGLKLLRKNNISRLPVVNTNSNNEKELVGIVSERDIARKLGSSKYGTMPPSRFHISSVMVKDVIAVNESMELVDVANLMLEKGIGSVPVESEDSMVGIVSKADFVTMCTTKAFEKILVKDYMNTDIKTIYSDERLVHARRILIDNKIGRLPVLDDDEIVGILTSKDIIRCLISFRKNVPEKHQQAQIKNITVNDIMSTNPKTISQDANILEVANILMETGYNGLPVLDDNNQLIGIITQTDLLKIFIES
ncbi:HPP family protein [Methanobrevibacter sp. DSM 116169]|uniref:CBS domain-containing protein n=1 Tax=Methanobrevibacter sp. DSM 116169 TaxID=3242727 RepID=UPI0038FCCC87